jgi:hypothetical protein
MQFNYSSDEVCAHKTGAVRQGSKETFTCRKLGRYVAVSLSRNKILTICEVEVRGHLKRKNIRDLRTEAEMCVYCTSDIRSVSTCTLAERRE